MFSIQITMFVHVRSLHPGLQMGFHAGRSVIPEPAGAKEIPAFPKMACRLCGYESDSCRSFTQHLGVHAESGAGVRSATDVVCGSCGKGFTGRRVSK